MKKVFIDGSAGTTGLRIKERLALRDDIEITVLPEETRKDENARKECILQSDAAILCLPDEAAVQAVSLAEGADTVIIDTSTAHRTDPGFVYGFAELTEEQVETVFEKFKILAETKKTVGDRDIEAIVRSEVLGIPEIYKLDKYVINSGNILIKNGAVGRTHCPSLIDSYGRERNVRNICMYGTGGSHTVAGAPPVQTHKPEKEMHGSLPCALCEL